MSYYTFIEELMKDSLLKIPKLSHIKCVNPTDCLLITC